MPTGAVPDERIHCAELLTRLDSMQRWVLADSLLLHAINMDRPVARGPRGRQLHRVLQWADRVFLTRPVLLAVGFVDVMAKLRRQRSMPCAAEEISRVFVGFGAGAEEALFNEYRNESHRRAHRVNLVDVASMGRIRRVGARDAMRTLWTACRTTTFAVRQLPGALRSRRIEFLTHGGLRLGTYSYMRAWFDGLRRQCAAETEICLLAADTTAFAAADAGAKTRYLQHGLIRRSLLLPDFDCIDSLTEDETQYFRRMLPRAAVRLRPVEMLRADQLTDEILVASVYEKADEMRRVMGLLDWARGDDRTVRVRPHPREDRSFWSNEVDPRLVQIEDGDASFHDALHRLRPRIVVSWYSTAIADALNCGIVPVTLSDEMTPAVADMVYPLLERALRWPRDKERIAEVMHSDAAYHATLQSLRGEASRSPRMTIDVFVLPSLSEGVPKVTQEAAACGLPVIVYCHYETPSVEHDRNGLVVWSDEELIAGIGRLLDDGGLRRKMGLKGAAMMRALAWDAVAPRWERSLRQWLAFDERAGIASG